MKTGLTLIIDAIVRPDFQKNKEFNFGTGKEKPPTTLGLDAGEGK